MPEGTRCIIRREPLHPGAQRSLFPSLDFRYWGFYTDREGDPVALDATMRAHAHVEQPHPAAQGLGALPVPLHQLQANTNWMMAVALAADLVRWFQLLCFDGPWVQRPTEGSALGALPRTGPSRPPLAPAHRAHHRRLARHRRSARRLPAHRTHHLSDLALPQTAPA